MIKTLTTVQSCFTHNYYVFFVGLCSANDINGVVTSTNHPHLFSPCLVNKITIQTIFYVGQEQKLKFNPYRYTFIDKASTFASSSSSSFSSNGRDSTYDYIVIGGGTAGCPLAATLSRNFGVLVLERGGVPFTNANVSFLRNFHIGLADTSASSASQAFVSTDGVYNARARVLGGGSCINAGFYSRADAA